MIYGPYKRQSKLRSIKPAQRTSRYNYKARPGKTVLCLRAAFAVCIATLLGLGGRMCCIWIMRQGRRGAYMLRMFRQFGNLS